MSTEINKDQILDAANECLLDMEQGWECVSKAVGRIRLENGREVEIQVKVTAEEFDFIGD